MAIMLACLSTVFFFFFSRSLLINEHDFTQPKLLLLSNWLNLDCFDASRPICANETEMNEE